MINNKLFEGVGIDGPAGAGKSTIAKTLAKNLDYLFVDTGAMYRAVTFAAMQKGVALEDEAAMGEVARIIKISFDTTGTKVFIDGEDVSKEIRTPELTVNIKFAARAPEVRDELVRQQQVIAQTRPVVMEGRDITTVVLKNAKWKFYLDASVECRAIRRQKDLAGKGIDEDIEKIKRDIEERDRSDFERKVGPLMRTDEQIYVDTSNMSQSEVVAHIEEIIKNG
jgi:cytidylate kinase